MGIKERNVLYTRYRRKRMVTLEMVFHSSCVALCLVISTILIDFILPHILG